jgi:TolB protein
MTDQEPELPSVEALTNPPDLTRRQRMKELGGVTVQRRNPARLGCGCLIRSAAILLLCVVLLLMLWVAIGATIHVGMAQALDSEPAWSPRGDRIAFSSRRTYKISIWLMNTDGSQLWEMLPGLPGANLYPAWSPDGTQIAYVYDNSGEVGIWVAGVPDHPGGEADAPVPVWCCEAFGGAVLLSHPSWSPDGTRIAFAAAGEGRFTSGQSLRDIWVVDANASQPNTNLRNLTRSRGADEQYVRWSPDGNRIVYSGPNSGDVPMHFLQHSAFEIDLQAGETRRLVDDAVDVEAAVWSPDGLWLAYGGTYNGNYDLMLMDMGRTQVLNLTSSSYWDDGIPTWSPDGRQLAFTSYQAGNFDIWRIDADGRNLTNLTEQTVEYRFPPMPWLLILGLIALLLLLIVFPSSRDWLRPFRRKKTLKPAEEYT